jgi:MoaA/NifB/PqqE/SkfB family radical SAM enzyme
MSCNYDCQGCYSRGRPTENELSTDELDALFAEAEGLGLASVVVTGGEPLMKDGLLDVIARHPRLMFVMITNGSLVTEYRARAIAACGNTLPLVSIEGLPEDTDERRVEGGHKVALRALSHLRRAGLCFGFAAMNTAANTGSVSTDEFIDRMSELGCSFGYITEYVPTGSATRSDYRVNAESRAALRQRVVELRRTRRLVLVQFPFDEYGDDNVCSGAGRVSLHVGSTGEIEPCPFVPVSFGNVRDGGLLAAVHSPLLREIRERPHLLKREREACSLFEHLDEVRSIADEMRSRSEREDQQRLTREGVDTSTSP